MHDIKEKPLAVPLKDSTSTSTVKNNEILEIADSCSLFDPGPDFGTKLNLGDDDSALVDFTLGFTFPFHGVSHTNLYVNSNGNLTFGGTEGTDPFSNSFITFINTYPRIAPYWFDIDPSLAGTNGGVFIKQLPYIFIVTWNNLPVWNTEESNPPINTFQVVLTNTGCIGFSYGDLDNNNVPLPGYSYFPLVGVAKGYGGPSSIFQYSPPQNNNPQQTITAPHGNLNCTKLLWRFDGTNYYLYQYTESPLIICPADITVLNSAGQNGAIVNYPDPSVSDTCGIVNCICSPPSGTFFPIGTTIVTCTVTNLSGNTASCSFNVKVVRQVVKTQPLITNFIKPF
ncbi:hypothetical protein JCM14036_25360 [Desulfotomaculum defluvii]